MPTIDEPVRTAGASSGDAPKKPEHVPSGYRPKSDWPYLAPVAQLQLEPWQYAGAYEPDRSGLKPLPTRQNAGKALRSTVPRAAHGHWAPPPDRPDPIAILARSNKDRQKELVPIRMGRMGSSPFAFLRVACMFSQQVWDLAHSPVTGLSVIANGDVHISVILATMAHAQRDIVKFDLNDFWTRAISVPGNGTGQAAGLKPRRLYRQNGLDRNERREAIDEKDSFQLSVQCSSPAGIR